MRNKMRERMKKTVELIKRLKREDAPIAEIMYQRLVVEEFKLVIGGLCSRKGCINKVRAGGKCRVHRKVAISYSG